MTSIPLHNRPAAEEKSDKGNLQKPNLSRTELMFAIAELGEWMDNLEQIMAWSEQQVRHNRARQFSLNYCSELDIFNYYRAKKEAYEQCIDLLRELAVNVDLNQSS